MAIGYIVDVYNEEVKYEKNIGILALFVSFFPLILSGPIERSGNMLPQFRNPKPINYDGISNGLKLMLWGFFMKLVVADRIGIYVDTVYKDLLHQNGTTLLITTILYPFQVYTDLGGYSLIAIGAAKILGFDVMQNFNRPFFATSMAEFWRRWHISLISWLTDYVYTPLSFTFRKFKIWGIVVALLLTFLISGIWHGASLSFIVWGLLQGIFLSIEALTGKQRSKFETRFNLQNKLWYYSLGVLLTFALFSISLIFSKADNPTIALRIISKIFHVGEIPYLDITTLVYSFIGIVIVFTKDFYNEFYPLRLKTFTLNHPWIGSFGYLAVIFFTLLFGVFNSNTFIYFQF